MKRRELEARLVAAHYFDALPSWAAVDIAMDSSIKKKFVVAALDDDGRLDPDRLPITAIEDRTTAILWQTIASLLNSDVPGPNLRELITDLSCDDYRVVRRAFAGADRGSPKHQARWGNPNQAQVMKWFTCEWGGYCGDAPSDDDDTVLTEYREHLSRNGTEIAAAGATELLELDLHDSRVVDWRYDPKANTFWWTLREARGPQDSRLVTITYSHAELVGIGAETLAAVDLVGNQCDLLFDEVDTTPTGLLEHRLLFWHGFEYGVVCHELGIRFRRVAVAVKPASSDHVAAIHTVTGLS